MKWTDIYDIAYALEQSYPDVDIFSISFTKLRSMVTDLANFSDEKDNSNEKILEAIQMAWSEERD